MTPEENSRTTHNTVLLHYFKNFRKKHSVIKITNPNDLVCTPLPYIDISHPFWKPLQQLSEQSIGYQYLPKHHKILINNDTITGTETFLCNFAF